MLPRISDIWKTNEGEVCREDQRQDEEGWPKRKRFISTSGSGVKQKFEGACQKEVYIHICHRMTLSSLNLRTWGEKTR